MVAAAGVFTFVEIYFLLGGARGGDLAALSLALGGHLGVAAQA
jgi:hypothetical protein